MFTWSKNASKKLYNQGIIGNLVAPNITSGLSVY